MSEVKGSFLGHVRGRDKWDSDYSLKSSGELRALLSAVHRIFKQRQSGTF